MKIDSLDHLVLTVKDIENHRVFLFESLGHGHRYIWWRSKSTVFWCAEN